ncbi:calcium-binding protein [Prochlorococcus marinus]|uniref:Uncharacterized protein n=1 Tax=Prochlorococcus marinus (strain MIT 9303) TaxID=59922 RepID=A2C7B0_PROM3|nr:calcium-binding protein [Prochlorococcus marinus]ABM77370.1 Hypothetical protein P9303_06181 [Prochlorococcus marinus str. MIT 9303]
MVLYSQEAHQYLVGDDQKAYFSESDDWIDATSAGYELIRGKETFLHSGNDFYQGTNFDSPGWDNMVRGNRGSDSLQGSWAAPSRDHLRGGKDSDSLDGGIGGNDFLHAARGDDWIWGSDDSSILRGGKGSDRIFGGNSRDVLLGAIGKDYLEGGGGSDLFMLRTNLTHGGSMNASTNIAEADRITDFNVADDYVILPGVVSHNDVWVTVDGADAVINVWDGEKQLIAGVIEGIAVGFDPGISDARIIAGGLADQINVETESSDAFLANPFLLDSFGI